MTNDLVDEIGKDIENNIIGVKDTPTEVSDILRETSTKKKEK